MIDTSLFGRLKRLFSTDVIIRNVGGNQVAVIDTDHIQSTGVVQTNMYPERYQRIYTGGLGTYLNYNQGNALLDALQRNQNMQLVNTGGYSNVPAYMVRPPGG